MFRLGCPKDFYLLFALRRGCLPWTWCVKGKQFIPCGFFSCVITALSGKNQCALKREAHEDSRSSLESPMSESGTGSSCFPVRTSGAISAHRVICALGLWGCPVIHSEDTQGCRSHSRVLFIKDLFYYFQFVHVYAWVYVQLLRVMESLELEPQFIVSGFMKVLGMNSEQVARALYTC